MDTLDAIKEAKMKAKDVLKKIIGKINYCRFFHSSTSDKNDNSKWHCNRCKISFKKLPSDYYTGI